MGKKHRGQSFVNRKKKALNKMFKYLKADYYNKLSTSWSLLCLSYVDILEAFRWLKYTHVPSAVHMEDISNVNF